MVWDIFLGPVFGATSGLSSPRKRSHAAWRSFYILPDHSHAAWRSFSLLPGRSHAASRSFCGSRRFPVDLDIPMQHAARFLVRPNVPMQCGARFPVRPDIPMQRGARFPILSSSLPPLLLSSSLPFPSPLLFDLTPCVPFGTANDPKQSKTEAKLQCGKRRDPRRSWARLGPIFEFF